MELARLSYVLHKKGSTKLPYLSTAPLAGEGEEAVLYVGQCKASSSSASSAGDAVEGRASMRGMEEMVAGMRNVCSKFFLPIYAKYSAQVINVYINKKLHIIVSQTESDQCQLKTYVMLGSILRSLSVYNLACR